MLRQSVRPVSMQSVAERWLDSYNEEAVMPMKAAPNVVWMFMSTIVEKRKKEPGEKEKKREMAVSEAGGERRKMDRLRRSSALLQPFVVVSWRQEKKWGRVVSMWSVV